MDFKRLFDIFPYQFAKYPQKTALAYRPGHTWRHFTTEESLVIIDKVSTAFLDLGLQRNDKIAFLFEYSTPYWNFLDFGIQQIGGVIVPVHANIGITELKYILADAEVKYCITSTGALYHKLKQQPESVESLATIFCLEKLDGKPGWEALQKIPDQTDIAAIQAIKAEIQEDDLATIIYTSGASGIPKGVMLSHKNIVSNIKATISLVPINYKKNVLSFLPLSHIFERMVTYAYIAAGASVFYIDQPQNLLEYAQEIRPNYFTSVPRLLEKIYDGIIERAGTMNKLGRRILHWSLKIGEQYQGRKGNSLSYFLKLKLADLLVYRRWRKALGGRIEGIVVGAAALRPQLGRIFSAAGIEIREGYGLTETSPVIAFNRFEPGGVHFGTVGIPIPGIEVKIDQRDETDEGEILVRGPGVMLGYWKNPELTAKSIDSDGWFRTGDIGKFVYKRFLKITDRKKDLFKTSSGKYISPQKIENLLNASPMIAQSIAVGFQKPYVTALIIPDMEKLKKWCERNKVHWTAPQFMAINPKVRQYFETIVSEINMSLTNIEKIRHFTLLHEDWEVETGEITPTLKLRRSYLLDKHSREIEEMYEK